MSYGNVPLWEHESERFLCGRCFRNLPSRDVVSSYVLCHQLSICFCFWFGGQKIKVSIEIRIFFFFCGTKVPLVYRELLYQVMELEYLWSPSGVSLSWAVWLEVVQCSSCFYVEPIAYCGDEEGAEVGAKLSLYRSIYTIKSWALSGDWKDEIAS